MYKLTQNNDSIIRIADQAFIPMVSGNHDYQEYLEWLDQGNMLKSADAEI